ncbi:DUF4913 domain-containing protein [Nocardia gipuzkoensis]|uniref:DUF4913 domain-containing protein n=1 Tax=Nocardia gipuzkoensis TaxID=2749991 RepID=UPI002D7EC0EC|nr:DUF4913 domain-containing protein [Nocardia gipuzkoensis]
MSQFPDDGEDLFQAQVLAKVDEMEATDPAPGGQAGARGKGGDEPPPPLFPNYIEWVTHWLAPMYARHVDDDVTSNAWCPWWLKHPEACSTFEAMWRAWEHYRLDGKTGISVWWRDHCHTHMSRLMDPAGTFKFCSVRGHFINGQLKPLPLASPGAVLSSPAFTEAGAVSTTTTGRTTHVGRLFARLTGR